MSYLKKIKEWKKVFYAKGNKRKQLGQQYFYQAKQTLKQESKKDPEILFLGIYQGNPKH